MKDPLLCEIDIESQECQIIEEHKEFHKNDLACIGLMLLFIFVHILAQIF
jgi:hypothetical protein